MVSKFYNYRQILSKMMFKNKMQLHLSCLSIINNLTTCTFANEESTYLCIQKKVMKMFKPVKSHSLTFMNRQCKCCLQWNLFSYCKLQQQHFFWDQILIEKYIQDQQTKILFIMVNKNQKYCEQSSLKNTPRSPPKASDTLVKFLLCLSSLGRI